MFADELSDLPVGVVLLRSDGGLYKANSTALRALPGLDLVDRAPHFHTPTWCLVDEANRWIADDLRGFFASRVTTEPLRDVSLRTVGPSGQSGLFRATVHLAQPNEQAWQIALVLVELTSDGVHRRVLDQTVQSAGIGTWQLDIRSGRVQYNEPWFAMLGYVRADWPQTASTWEQLAHPDDIGRVIELVSKGINSDDHSFRTEYRLRHRSGRTVWVLLAGAAVDFDMRGNASKVVGVHLDITSSKDLERRLLDAASTDSLTGLLNRSGLSQAMRAAGSIPEKEKVQALLYIDLDRFKLVNDTLGHLAGDELLRQFSRRLTGFIASWRRESPDQPAPLVARAGGDEFLIALGPLGQSRIAWDFAERLVNVMNRPFVVNGRSVHSSISIGVATQESWPVHFEELHRNADIALYEAKRAGRGRWSAFTEAMREQLMRTVDLEASLRDAVRSGQGLNVFYQPIVSLHSGQILGVEALARWTHPTLGAVPPSDFIPVAEESGLIEQLGQFVLERACSDLAQVRSLPDLENLWCAVNVSKLQLTDRSLTSRILHAISMSALPLSALHIEVTETISVADDETRCALNSLSQAGLAIALDDFGTGYSSLSMLERLPVHSLKIDKSFVDGVTSNSFKMALIEATVMVAAVRGLKVVAEGIETELQAALLRQAGCQLGQGYWYGRPVPAADLIKKLNIRARDE